MSEIKNIIFDLGGVIINLDIEKTIKDFNKLSINPFESVYTQLNQITIFNLFDKGQITQEDFISEIKKKLGNKITSQNIVLAWNAMLLDFPQHRLKMLNTLKLKYRIFLLSNTNETHITQFEKQLYATHGYKNLEPFFEKVYYSCRMGMRKPDAEIFEFVIAENNLIASETLFIDDSPQHVEGALITGLIAHLLKPDTDIEELLSELKLL